MQEVEMAETWYKWLWHEKVWLPDNVTWQDYQDDNLTLPQPWQLCFMFPMALLLLFARIFFERFIALPIGRAYKLSERPPRQPKKNDVLEAAFKIHKRRLPDQQHLQVLSKKTDWSVRQIERWWRYKRYANKPSQMSRFAETAWRFFYYFTQSWLGIYILIDDVPSEIFWYYMFGLGFYFSLMISSVLDNKRSDFWQMILHHIATICLMGFTWCINMVRGGSLVVVVHDPVDYFLEGAKFFHYLGYTKVCDFIFVCFALLWLVSRLIVFPYWLLYLILNDGLRLYGAFPVFAFLACLLYTLLILHVIWFRQILRAVHTFVFKGKIDKDERSETEPESETDDEQVCGNNNQDISEQNGRVKTKT